MVATELALLPLNPGVDIEDADSEAGKALTKVFATLKEQPGYQRAFYGIEVENNNMLRVFIDWDTVDAHLDFTKKDYYKAFMDSLSVPCDLSKAALYHTHFTPFPPSEALSSKTSPVTELLTVYFPTSYSSEDQQSFSKTIEEFFKHIAATCDELIATAHGWIVEDVVIPGSETDEKARVLIGTLGWKSVDAHMRYRETDAFKKNVPAVRNAKDVKKLQAVHYVGKES